MAKQIEGVYERVIECAKAEFLEKGFNEASLRTIALKAGTSTSSIYTRFFDKKDLFKAIVSPVADELKAWFISQQDAFDKLPNDVKKADSLGYSKSKIFDFVEYVYNHYDEFKLLVSCADGTTFSNYINELVEISMEYTRRFFEAIGNDTISTGKMPNELLHMITSAYFSGIFETVLHDMDRKSAHSYTSQLQRFYQVGWEDIINTDNYKNR